MGQSQCFGIIIGQFRPLPSILWLCEIQKICDFQFLGANLATCFFKIRFGAKLVLEPLKMVFLILFRSWKWFTSIFELLKFWVFMHFFILKFLVFANFDATYVSDLLFCFVKNMNQSLQLSLQLNQHLNPQLNQHLSQQKNQHRSQL